MANFIPDGKVSEIKNSADIVGIISETVVLKKSGANYSGLCPFHSEKTPSFTVSPEKQIFHCFGCGLGGDLFTFLMKKDGLTFPESVKFLARRCGVEIPSQKMSPEQKRRLAQRDSLLNINRAAMDFFTQTLHSQAGKKAALYLKKRKMDDRSIEDFSLGYAPGGWSGLVNHFKKKGYPNHLAEKIGLIMPNKRRDGFYDRFRDRIIFPIFDGAAQVIGFGGRVMDDSMPKYLNSPDSPIYSKGRSLYALGMARNECRAKKTVYITEGYFDVIALHQHGIKNSIATLGTALSPMHVQMIKGLIGEDGVAVLLFDSDEAGIKAAHRSIGLFEKNFVDVKIHTLDSGHDPDSFLFEFGAEAFRQTAEKALDVVPFLMDRAEKKHGRSVQGKIRVASDMKGPLMAVKDNVARSFYIRHLAERLKIDESVIIGALKDGPSPTGPEKNVGAGARRVMESTPEKGLTQVEYDKSSRIEFEILKMMLQSPWVFPKIKTLDIIDSFNHKMLKSIGRLILEVHKDSKTAASDIIARIEDDEQRRVFASIAIENKPWSRQGALDLIEQFEAGRRSRRDTILSKKIKEAEAAHDHERLLELLNEKKMIAAKEGQTVRAT